MRRGESLPRGCEAVLRQFADAVRARLDQSTAGEAEAQLRGPFVTLLQAVGEAVGKIVVCTGERPAPDRLGRPDYAVHSGGLLVGYAALKAPGAGADPGRFRGHHRAQAKRFAALPNLLYTDGQQWALYRHGERCGRVVRLSGDPAADGGDAVTTPDAAAWEALLRDFLSWQPVIPTDRRGGLDLPAFASLLAPLCRFLRDEVTDGLAAAGSPLRQLAADWRQLLFPDATDSQFADAYAQTMTFALLQGRSEGAAPLTFQAAQQALAAQHNLLARALQVLTDPAARQEMSTGLEILLRVIGAVPTTAFKRLRDPWLNFYEQFLAAYDPQLRRDAGAYYTPVEVVRAQVRLVDGLLTHRLGQPQGFAAPDVVTLDPAAGTGTYLLGVIEHTLDRVADAQGEGAVAGQATALATRLHGFELMVGPYAVTDLRVSRALLDRGAMLPADGPGIYLTDTLASPAAEHVPLPRCLRPIADQQARALRVKRDARVLVCLGNPPYDRHEAAVADNLARTGGWVRWGDHGDGEGAILGDFLDPALAAGHGRHIKNLYNLYVYFWRWAIWKVFESETACGPGLVSFITAASYLDGDAFVGLREHLRRQCDELWILDLGGEGRGARRSENIFAIQTPVAIAFALRAGEPRPDQPATVRYTRLEGTAAEKLAALDELRGLDQLSWEDCPDAWQAPFRPAGGGPYFTWPRLTDLMPWQHSGVQVKRTWPISFDRDLLAQRWRALLTSADRTVALGGANRDGRTDPALARPHRAFVPGAAPAGALLETRPDAPCPPRRRYSFRSFDRQWLLADERLIARPRPDLWAADGPAQVYLTSLLTKPLGAGPALTASVAIPDLDHFSGRGAKDAIPLYRDAAGELPNLVPGLLDLLSAAYERRVSPEDWLAYLYGVLAHPAFTARFATELASRELRVPLTRDPDLFERLRAIGVNLLRLHTYGERYVPDGEAPGRVGPGEARCLTPVSDRYPERFEHHPSRLELSVGNGVFAPVSAAVFGFEVSGLLVLQSWLRYRMRDGAGRKSSPLDDLRPAQWTGQQTTELLELLWVLEATVAGYPAQEAMLAEVVAGPCFHADELPAPSDWMRLPPSRQSGLGGLFSEDEVS